MSGPSPIQEQLSSAEDIDPVSILRQLDRILASKRFRDSKRYTAVLDFVVRQTLAGHEDSLKERTLGVEVFHRRADYDTSVDPVVRVTVGEVRKRLAQFYLEPEHASDLRIELPLGTYVPEFGYPKQRSAPEEPVKAERPGVAIEPPTALSLPIQEAIGGADPIQEPRIDLISPETSNSRLRYVVLAVVAVILISVAIVAGPGWWVRHNEEAQFWGPFLKNRAPIVILMGQPVDPDPQTTASEDIFQNQHTAQNEVFLPDAITLSRVSNILGPHRYRVASARQASDQALLKTPLILVGGFNNPWTTRLLQPLPFSLVEAGSDVNPSLSPQVLEIVDHRSKARSPWVVDFRQPIEKMSHDYSIIARFHDDATEGPVIVIAGLGSTGTQSAGTFVSSSAYMNQLAAWAPRNWAKKNMEAVIDTEIVDGNPGHPKIVAAEFW